LKGLGLVMGMVALGFVAWFGWGGWGIAQDVARNVATAMVKRSVVDRPLMDCRAPIIQLTPGQSLLSLGPYLEVLEDRTRVLSTVEQVAESREFRPMAAISMNLGHTDSAWWFRFSVKLEEGQNWYFDPDWAYFRTLDFYSPLLAPDQTGGLWKLSAYHFGAKNGGRLIPLIADGQNHTYYFTAYSERITFVRPTLCMDDRCLAENNLRGLAYGAFAAVLAAMCIYNFFIFLYLRDRSYLWFVVFHTALLAYFSSKQWTPFFSYDLQLTVAAASINVCAMSMCFFLRDFLETQKLHPFWDRLLLIWASLSAALILLGPWLLSPQLHTVFNIVCNVVVFLMGFCVSLRSGFKGYWTGRLLFLVWTLVAIPFFIFASTAMGWTSLGYSLGFNLVLAGEAVLVSLVLAYRIRLLKLEGEASASATHAKNLFLARMSHEIRTPMTAILGFTGLALQMPSSEQIRQYLLKVKTSAGHLLGLINDILDLAKIEAGKLDMERKVFDLADLLREVCDIVAPKAEENGNELLCHMADDIPVRFLGDPMRLRQVLVNLVGNAVKFTCGGEVRLEVGRTVAGKKADSDLSRTRLYFEVSDTGTGIPQERLRHLFEPFEQGGVDIANRYGGTGLGLNISSRLVELMGGRIGVTSEPGQGSTFWFTLDLDHDSTPHPPRLEVPPDLKGLPILIADDHAGARNALVRILRKLGFAPTPVESGLQAVEAVLQSPDGFALVILDWNMPVMDGVETLSKLRSCGLPKSVPALLATLLSSTAQEDQKLCEVGVVGFLVKPFTPVRVLKAVMDALHHTVTRCDDDFPHGQEKPLQVMKGLRVLLVDDNVFNLEVARIILEQAGAATEVALNGVEALERLETAKVSFDAVLMDMSMPVMDGLEASRRIRSMVKYQDLIIIAMTANAMKGDREACLSAGMNDHLAKPIDPQELFAVLERWDRRVVDM